MAGNMAYSFCCYGAGQSFNHLVDFSEDRVGYLRNWTPTKLSGGFCTSQEPLKPKGKLCILS